MISRGLTVPYLSLIGLYRLHYVLSEHSPGFGPWKMADGDADLSLGV